MTGAGAFILFVALAQAAAPAAAAPDSAAPAAAKARAQALLRDGTALFEAGNYPGALEKFEAALAAFPSPKILFNIGAANRNLLRYVEALQAFEEFLARAPDAPAQTIGDARGFVAELKAKLGRIQIECRVAGAEVSLDGKRAGLTPLPAPVWAMPGRHQIAVRHPDHVPAIEDVDVAAGAVRELAVDLRPLAPAIDLPASRPAPPDPGAGRVPSAGE
jgi:tetratricopeptide (TPR) repeat protein